MDARGSVEEGVQAKIDELDGPDPALAALALALARELDDAENSATSKSMCGRALLDAMKQLRELAPQVPKGDKLDELSDRRARRRARTASVGGS